jgi:hypothetical protein
MTEDIPGQMGAVSTGMAKRAEGERTGDFEEVSQVKKPKIFQ